MEPRLPEFGVGLKVSANHFRIAQVALRPVVTVAVRYRALTPLSPVLASSVNYGAL